MEFVLSLNNNGTSTGVTTVREESSQSIPIFIFRVLICVVGVIGNLLVIFVVLVLKEYKKTITHWYVLHLSIADLIFLLTIPFKIDEDAANEWRFSGGMCKAVEAFLFLNYYASVLFLVVMSIDRYIAVCHCRSVTLDRLRTKKAAYITTVIVWITSLLFCIPIIMYSDKRGTEPQCKCTYDFPRNLSEVCIRRGLEGALDLCISIEEDKKKCMAMDDDLFSGISDYSGGEVTTAPSGDAAAGSSESSDTMHHAACSYAEEGPGWFRYLYFLFIVMFLLPLLVMTVCYTLIIRQLRKTQKRHNSITVSDRRRAPSFGRKRRTPSATTTKSDRNFMRVNIICIVLVLLFLICWLPFHANHLAKMNGIIGTKKTCEQVMLSVTILAYLNSALNPYIYNFFGTRFGKRLRSAAGSVRYTVRKRTSSLSSAMGGTVRLKYKSQDTGNSTSSATGITRVQPGKITGAVSLVDSNDVRETQIQDTSDGRNGGK